MQGLLGWAFHGQGHRGRVDGHQGTGAAAVAPAMARLASAAGRGGDTVLGGFVL